jgi:DNA-binding transcriptional MerR regulator
MDLYPIGELARRSGVPVKTIRHYSDLGVLPPAQVTRSRYRLYSDNELVRLGLIRSLRAAGFDLPTIAELLGQSMELGEAVQLQLEAVEIQLRTLQRQRQVLKAAVRRREVTLDHLARTSALARLEAAERARFLQRHVQEMVEGVPVDPVWWERFLSAATPELPEDASDEQLAAWLELAELSSDPAFVTAQRDQARSFWTGAPRGLDFDAWCRRSAEITQQACALLREGTPPDAPVAQELLDRWLALQGEAWGQPVDEAALLASYDAPTARLGRRYWALVAQIRGDEAWGPSATHDWLLEGLRARNLEREERP